MEAESYRFYFKTACDIDLEFIEDGKGSSVIACNVSIASLLGANGSYSVLIEKPRTFLKVPGEFGLRLFENSYLFCYSCYINGEVDLSGDID